MYPGASRVCTSLLQVQKDKDARLIQNDRCRPFIKVVDPKDIIEVPTRTGPYQFRAAAKTNEKSVAEDSVSEDSDGEIFALKPPPEPSVNPA